MAKVHDRLTWPSIRKKNHLYSTTELIANQRCESSGFATVCPFLRFHALKSSLHTTLRDLSRNS